MAADSVGNGAPGPPERRKSHSQKRDHAAMLDSNGPAAFDGVDFNGNFPTQSNDQNHEIRATLPQSELHLSRSISGETNISGTNTPAQHLHADDTAQSDRIQIGSQDTHKSIRLHSITSDEPSRNRELICGNMISNSSISSAGSPPVQARALSGMSSQHVAREFQMPMNMGHVVSQGMGNKDSHSPFVHPTEASSHQSSLMSPPAGDVSRGLSQIDTLRFPGYEAFGFDFEGPSGNMDLQMSPNMDGLLDISPSMMALSPSYLHERFRQDQRPRSPFSIEQLKRIQKLWPRQKTVSVTRLIRTLWRDTVQHGADNLFSDPDPCNLEPSSVQSPPSHSRWNMDDDCRNRLMSDISALGSRGPPSNVDSDFAAHSPEAGQLYPSPGFAETLFPSTGTLDTSLDFFFRSSYPMMAFIHKATFDARKTPTSLLFPMCLIGLSVMDPQSSRDFVRQYLVVRLRAEEGQCVP